jgi:hypothetical protein
MIAVARIASELIIHPVYESAPPNNGLHPTAAHAPPGFGSFSNATVVSGALGGRVHW